MSHENPTQYPSQDETPFQERFDEQFARSEVVKLPGEQEATFYDIKPEHPKSEVPVFMAGGYGSTDPIGIRGNAMEMVRNNREVIMVEAPHGVSHDIRGEEVSQMSEYSLRQIGAIMPALEQKHIEKVDVVATSESCVYAVMAAYLYPEKFRNMILVNPGGMIGEDKPTQLTWRFITEMVAGAVDLMKRKKMLPPEAQQQMKEGTADFMKYIFSDVRTAGKEIKGISSSQINGLFQKLKEHGIGISIIHSVDDKVFPMKRVQAQVKAKEEDPLWIDGFYSVKGGHGEYLANTQIYTRAAEGALSALEMKQAVAADKKGV